MTMESIVITFQEQREKVPGQFVDHRMASFGGRCGERWAARRRLRRRVQGLQLGQNTRSATLRDERAEEPARGWKVQASDRKMERTVTPARSGTDK